MKELKQPMRLVERSTEISLEKIMDEKEAKKTNTRRPRY